MTTLVSFLVIMILVYTFMGVVSFIPYIIGLLYGAFFFPIEIFKQVIYPVGPLPYIIWAGGISVLVILLIIRLVFSHSK